MMISLIVVALVGIGFTRLTMLALELRDNYEDGTSDEPVDMSRKRVDAHNRMVNMPKPEKMVVTGENRYEPNSSASSLDGNGDGSYSSMLASTEATLQAGFNALFGPNEQNVPFFQSTVQDDEVAKDTTNATSKPSKDKDRCDPEAAQPNIVLDPTVRHDFSYALALIASRPQDVCTICFEKAKNAVLLDCGHGGVCYNCSIDVYVTSGHCPFCRSEISQIVTVGFGHSTTDSAGNTIVPVIGPR